MIGLPTKVSVFDDIAYDESGNRIWYSVENADGSGYTQATLLVWGPTQTAISNGSTDRIEGLFWMPTFSGP